MSIKHTLQPHLARIAGNSRFAFQDESKNASAPISDESSAAKDTSAARAERRDEFDRILTGDADVTPKPRNLHPKWNRASQSSQPDENTSAGTEEGATDTPQVRTIPLDELADDLIVTAEKPNEDATSVPPAAADAPSTPTESTGSTGANGDSPAEIDEPATSAEGESDEDATSESLPETAVTAPEESPAQASAAEDADTDNEAETTATDNVEPAQPADVAASFDRTPPPQPTDWDEPDYEHPNFNASDAQSQLESVAAAEAALSGAPATPPPAPPGMDDAAQTPAAPAHADVHAAGDSAGHPDVSDAPADAPADAPEEAVGEEAVAEQADSEATTGAETVEADAVAAEATAQEEPVSAVPAAELPPAIPPAIAPSIRRKLQHRRKNAAEQPEEPGTQRATAPAAATGAAQDALPPQHIGHAPAQKPAGVPTPKATSEAETTASAAAAGAGAAVAGAGAKLVQAASSAAARFKGARARADKAGAAAQPQPAQPQPAPAQPNQPPQQPNQPPQQQRHSIMPTTPTTPPAAQVATPAAAVDRSQLIDPTRFALWTGVIITVIGLILGLVLLSSSFSAVDDSISQKVDSFTTNGQQKGKAATPQKPAPAPEVAPQVANVAIVQPEGDGDEQPELLPRLRDGNVNTEWSSRWYADPDYAGLQPFGIVITLKEEATIKEIVLNSSAKGGKIDVYAGNAQDPQKGEVLATGEFGGDPLKFAQPVKTKSLVLWVAKLPTDADGKFRATIQELTVK